MADVQWRAGLLSLATLLLTTACSGADNQSSQESRASAAGPLAASAPLKPAASVTPQIAVPPAGGADIVMRGAISQGGYVRGRVPAGVRALRANGQPVRLAEDGAFIIGFDRDAAPLLRIEARSPNGTVLHQEAQITLGGWQIEQVNANPTGGAATTAEYQRRRAGELAQINAARAIDVTSDGWRQVFIRPASGRISGRFGSQRIYRGSPGSYHSGADIAAPTGTIYVAPADGVVTLAAQTPFTLEGYLLIVDHGMGLSSAFLHSSRLLVKQGDVVRQGQPLGMVGATGRASGPHLHWGMKWNHARLDPLRFLPPQP